MLIEEKYRGLILVTVRNICRLGGSVNRNHSAMSGDSDRNVAHIRCIMRLSYGTSLR